MVNPLKFLYVVMNSFLKKTKQNKTEKKKKKNPKKTPTTMVNAGMHFVLLKVLQWESKETNGGTRKKNYLLALL